MKYNKSGFSLVELIVALAIASVVLVTATQFLSSVLKQYGKDTYEIKLQTEVEEILNLVENWVMDAETVEVVAGDNGNDKLKLEKVLSDGTTISSEIYVRATEIYYSKIYSSSSEEVFLGTHVSDSSKGKSLSFKISENKKTVQVGIKMSFGSSEYDATRKILLRNWEKDAPQKDSDKDDNDDSVATDFNAEITGNPVVVVPKNNSPEFSINFSIKNTSGNVSLANGGENGNENGIKIKVYFFFEAKDATAEELNNKNLWSCDNGIVSSISINEYPNAKESNNYKLYYGVAEIKSTIDLEKNTETNNLGWLWNNSISHTIKCNLNINKIDMKMNEYHSNYKGGELSQTYIEVYYAGELKCTIGNKDSVPPSVMPGETETYEITFDANGGYNAPSKQTKTTGETIKISNAIPLRDGFSFVGWSTDKNANVANYFANQDYSSDASVVLYAIWYGVSVEYTIQYDLNGGYNYIGNQTKKQDENLTLTSDKPERNGYTFIGWSVSRDSETVDYSSGSVYSENRSIVLYAVWSQNKPKYSVSYNLNGGNNGPANQEGESGEELKLSTQTPELDCCEFLGWAMDVNSSTAQYQPGDSLTLNSDITLYAVWKDNREIKLNVNAWVNGDTSYIQLNTSQGKPVWNKLEIRYYYMYKGDYNAIMITGNKGTEVIEDHYITEFVVNNTKYQYGYISYINNSDSALNSYEQLSLTASNHEFAYIDSSNGFPFSATGKDAVCLYYDGALIFGKVPSYEGLMIKITGNNVSAKKNKATVSVTISKYGANINWSDVTLTYYWKENADKPYKISNIQVTSGTYSGYGAALASQVSAADGTMNKVGANASATFRLSGSDSSKPEKEVLTLSFDVSGDVSLLNATDSFSCDASGNNIYGTYSGSLVLTNGNAGSGNTFGSYPTRDIVAGAKVITEVKYGSMYVETNAIKQLIIEYEVTNQYYGSVTVTYGRYNNNSALSKYKKGVYTETYDLSNKSEGDIYQFSLSKQDADVKSVTIIYK